MPSEHLPDWIGLGVLAAAVPRNAIAEALAAHWRGVKRRSGKLPPHGMVHFAVGMALYADADYEEIITELSDALDRLGSWDADWEVPGSGAITRARQRLGDAVPADVLDAAAQPVAGLLTPGAFLSGWRPSTASSGTRPIRPLAGVFVGEKAWDRKSDPAGPGGVAADLIEVELPHVDIDVRVTPPELVQDRRGQFQRPGMRRSRHQCGRARPAGRT
ncbi:transposase domain-containing protein, partial [Streptomyces sp. NPDC001999]